VGHHQKTPVVLLVQAAELRRRRSSLASAATSDGIQWNIFGASWGSLGEDFIGQSPDVVRKDPTAVSISNSSLEAMIPLGSVKQEKFPIPCFAPVSW
jgi:hypothetical protein